MALVYIGDSKVVSNLHVLQNGLFVFMPFVKQQLNHHMMQVSVIVALRLS